MIFKWFQKLSSFFNLNVESVFETGWTTVRNWCPRTSVHQAGTRVKTWCLPPLLHEIFFCAREIGVAHSWAKLYVATTGDHAWCFNKTGDRVVFLRSIRGGICVTSLLYSSLSFFFFFLHMYRAWKKFERGTTELRKQRWKFSNCSFVFSSSSSSFFLFRKRIERCLEYELHWNGWKQVIDVRILLSGSDQWKNRLLELKLTLVKLYVFAINLSPRTTACVY